MHEFICGLIIILLEIKLFFNVYMCGEMFAHSSKIKFENKNNHVTNIICSIKLH